MDNLCIDLIDNLLNLNPNYRLSSSQALEHDFFKTEPLPCENNE